MINRIANNTFFKENKHAGIYIDILSESDYRCRVVVLEKKQKHLHILQKEEVSLDKLSTVVSTKIPVSICVDGKGILSREFNLKLTDEALIHQAFPNVNASDYYAQQMELAHSKTFVCFARKVTIDTILQKIIEQNFTPLHLSLGCLPVSHIVTLLNSGETLAFPYIIKKVDNSVEQIKKNTEPTQAFVPIGDESIPTEYILPFALALGYFSNGEFDDLPSDLLLQKQKDHTYLSVAKKGSFAFLMLAFVVLLINFVVFGYANKQQQILSQQLEQHQGTLQQLEKYRQEVSEKEKILGGGYGSYNSYFSYYADRIAASKPDGIILQKMNICPVEIKNKKVDIISLRKDTIEISGVTQNSSLLNTWLKTIQKESFVRQAEITNYAQQDANNGLFSLRIAINPHKN